MCKDLHADMEIHKSNISDTIRVSERLFLSGMNLLLVVS